VETYKPVKDPNRTASRWKTRTSTRRQRTRQAVSVDLIRNESTIRSKTNRPRVPTDGNIAPFQRYGDRLRTQDIKIPHVTRDTFKTHAQLRCQCGLPSCCGWNAEMWHRKGRVEEQVAAKTWRKEWEGPSPASECKTLRATAVYHEPGDRYSASTLSHRNVTTPASLAQQSVVTNNRSLPRHDYVYMFSGTPTDLMTDFH
jgi:hypothetical protein